MPKLTLLFAITLAALAFAGTRFKEFTGGVPTAATDGVSIGGGTVGCRGSVRVADGGSVMGGTLVPYYYDATLRWVEGPSTSACALDTTVQADGGNRLIQFCEWKVRSNFGRASFVAKNIVGATTPASVNARIECWDPTAPVSDGGNQ